MDALYLIGASQAFFFSFLAIKKERKTPGDITLSLWLAILGLHLLGYYSSSTGFALEHPHLLGIDFTFPMLHGPFLYLYIKTMVTKSGKFKPVYYLHFLPFGLFTLYFIFDFHALGATGKLLYFKSLEADFPFVYQVADLFNNYLSAVYVILSWVLIKKHSNNLLNDFSYTEDIDFAWLRNLLFMWAVVWFVVIITELFPFFDLGQELARTLIYISVTIVVFCIGYFGIKQQVIYNVVASTNPTEYTTNENGSINRYKNSGLKKEDAKSILDELLTYIKEEKPFLNEKLNLQDVANVLNVSTHHLSQIINENLNRNFFDFINEYRVEEVKRLISESKHEQLTLLGVAYDSGFNSKSSFNRIFKKFTQMTPSEYVNSLDN